LEGPILQALAEAGLAREQLHEIEIVGGTSRVNCVKRRLGEILGLDASLVNYGLKTTMNSDEAVCRGGALQCAMLSSRVKVKPFNIVDKIPYGIVAHFESPSSGAQPDTPNSEDR
jgi:heat shock 70kDa protein 4